MPEAITALHFLSCPDVKNAPPCAAHPPSAQSFRRIAEKSLILGGTASAIRLLMNPQFEPNRQQLLVRRAQLIARHQETTAEEKQALEEREADWIDAATMRSTVDLLDRMSDEEIFQLRRIDDALSRIVRGTYGRCVVCGSEIVRARLRVVPEADRCAACSNSH
jgi:DnaK suppressor protein